MWAEVKGAALVLFLCALPFIAMSYEVTFQWIMTYLIALPLFLAAATFFVIQVLRGGSAFMFDFMVWLKR